MSQKVRIEAQPLVEPRRWVDAVLAANYPVRLQGGATKVVAGPVVVIDGQPYGPGEIIAIRAAAGRNDDRQTRRLLASAQTEGYALATAAGCLSRLQT